MASEGFFAAFGSKGARQDSDSPFSDGKVTPQRRPRPVDDDDESDISVDENGSIRSHSSKRQRRHGTPPSQELEEEYDTNINVDEDEVEKSDLNTIHQDETNEDMYGSSVSPVRPTFNNGARDSTSRNDAASASPERPLLPDSFRRSPRQNTSRDSMNTAPAKHQPGAIVRVTLTNFVTYTKAEFHPGPNLNMIIGPNGTGKSTLVCALCLGLGWKPDHLGRAKDVGEFVKYGSSHAIIEIELAADPERHDQNPVVTTKITRDGNKTESMVSGRKVTKKALADLMGSFTIQIDNLCQFLPQDRVVEFAKQSPIDRLSSTLKAAAPAEMTEQYESLKTFYKDRKVKLEKQQEDIDRLKQKETRHKAQEADVTRLRERQDLQARFDTLTKLAPFPKYRAAQDEFREKKDVATEAQNQLVTLEARCEPNRNAILSKQRYAQQCAAHATSVGTQVGSSQERLGKIKREHEVLIDKIKDKRAEHSGEKEKTADLKASRATAIRNIQKLEADMQNDPGVPDVAKMNAEVREIQRKTRPLEEQISTLEDEQEAAKEEGKQRTQLLRRVEDQIARSQTQAGQQENKLKHLSPDTAKAWEWVSQNQNLFRDTVYGPPALVCKVKESSHAGAVESVLGEWERLALTVTSDEDFTTLDNNLRTLGIKQVAIRTSAKSLDQYHARVSREELVSMGMEGFIIELIDGPEPVLAMLCDNRNFHQIGFTTGDITNDQYKRLSSRLNSWVTSKEVFSVSRRAEYGASAYSARTTPLRQAQIFTDAPADHSEDDNNAQERDRLKAELANITRQFNQRKSEIASLEKEKAELEAEAERINADKRRQQAQRSQFDALPVKLEQQRRDLKEAEDALAATTENWEKIHVELDELLMKKADVSSKFQTAIEALRRMLQAMFKAEIARIEAQSDAEQLELMNEEEEKLIEQHRETAKRAKKESDEAKARGRKLLEQCQNVMAGLDEDELVIREEIGEWRPPQYNTEMDGLEARLSAIGGNANHAILQQYEQRAKEIGQIQARLRTAESDIHNLDQQIKEIRDEWEPSLDALVEEISRAFGDNFGKIQCVGEVCVDKEKDFDKWALQIKVKFRETEDLCTLDSHRQSGGERSVSTIFFLMALQSLARAPFRVVDEINQGMDPRNERMVHSRIVDIACGENSASQYFLITPKLLNGLHYHRTMKVHCIGSGEHMPQEHGKLDFAALAKKALAIKGVA